MSREQKMTVDSIKNTLNHFPGAVWWHDGKADDNCNFHGLHLHAIFSCEKELSKTYHFRTFRNRLNNVSGKIPGSDGTVIDVKTQHVKFSDSLIRHLNQEPRILLGVNNLYLAARIHKVNTSPRSEDNKDIYPGVDFSKDDYIDQLKDQHKDSGINFLMKRMQKKESEGELPGDAVLKSVPKFKTFISDLSKQMTQPNDKIASTVRGYQFHGSKQQPVLATSKTAQKVDVVKELIEKYQKKSIDELLRCIIRQNCKEELELFRTLRLGPNFKDVFMQALNELDIEANERGDTYIDAFARNVQPLPGSLTRSETAAVFLDWCREQNISAPDLLLKFFLVLDKSFPKLNSIMLQGASNAGKTYWAKAVLSLGDMVGQTIQSTDFAYQQCLDKLAIQIPELSLTKPEQVEEFKKVCEGLPIQINIKNKEPRRLPRTPVILTCNEVPWKNFGNEAAPILNRMFAWRNLCPSRVLQHIDGKDADPRFFAEMFSFIHEKIASRPEWCPVEDVMQKVNYYELYIDMIADYLRQLIREEAMTLTDVINQGVLEERNDLPIDFAQWEKEHVDDRLNCNAVLTMDDDYTEDYQKNLILHWLDVLKNPDSIDYYWNFDDFRRPILLSKLTDEEYDLEADIDERDYASFKRGYIIIQRLLILIKNFPHSQGGQKSY